MENKGVIFLTIGGIGLALGTVLLIRHFTKPDGVSGKSGSGGNGTPLPGGVPDDIDYLPGKMIFAKESNTKLRTGPFVNNGYINNILKTYLAGEFIGTMEQMVDSTDPNDQHKWYYVKMYKPIYPGNEKLSKGYVREDVIDIK